jgi:hypothetical protein
MKWYKGLDCQKSEGGQKVQIVKKVWIVKKAQIVKKVQIANKKVPWIDEGSTIICPNAILTYLTIRAYF